MTKEPKTLHPRAARRCGHQRHREFRRPIRSGRLPPAAVGETDGITRKQGSKWRLRGVRERMQALLAREPEIDGQPDEKK